MTIGYGDRVVVQEDADYSPYTFVHKGERGTVVADYGCGNIDIRLDRYHPGLTEERNTIWITGGDVLVEKMPARNPLTTVAWIVSGAFLIEAGEAAFGDINFNMLTALFN